MKKLFALFALCMLTFSCFSCDEKKQDEDIPEEVKDILEEVEDTAETPDTGDTVVENHFRDYSEDDFKTITVPITYTDKDSPIVLKSYDIPDIDFGERIAPCKTSDDPSQFDPLKDRVYTWTDEDGVEHTPQSTYMQLLDTPEEGVVTGAVKSGDRIYMVVNYDSFCSGCHEWSVYSYNMNTKETKVIYNYSGIDEQYDGGYWITPQIVANHIIFTGYNSRNYSYTKTIAINLDTGEEKIINQDEDYYSFKTDGINRVQFYHTENDENDHHKMKLTIKEYSFDTDKLETIVEDIDTKMFSAVPSELSAYLVKPLDSRRCQLVTDHYCIETGVTNAEILYASDKKAIILTTGMSNVLHTFDLEKAEHYVTDIGEIAGTQASYGENIVISDSNHFNDSVSSVYYVMPELGLVFTVADKVQHGSITKVDGTVTFNRMENGTISLSENASRGYNKPVTIYWIEEE